MLMSKIKPFLKFSSLEISLRSAGGGTGGVPNFDELSQFVRKSQETVPIYNDQQVTLESFPKSRLLRLSRSSIDVASIILI